ncbi:hypothetical protein FisN_15Lh355 [Fistulifera solaris]|uniref:Uncharacterized protein n=1 Tax=Fistulifera solaris TaxID=1519565 RepID=A0A1Z5JZB9_FISSO|nr:hypothetical protein FisN_15Lh355 [Fistulifera solaris]|eukprot:GAX19178.1 hypothetical protein FisN_15Lh355 [Fistulifera solaris]
MIYSNLFLLSWLLCVVSAQEDEVIQLTNEPCVDWEATAAAYQEAFAEWQESECYTFTYTFLGFSVGEPGSVTRTVRNGVALEQDDDQPFGTLTDVWKLIEERCILNCPENGAHTCDIEFTTREDGNLVYPAFVSINPDAMLMDEELIYRIHDVRTLDCAELEMEEGEEVAIKADVCLNYETVKTTLEAALLQWENITRTCYNYTIERVGRVTEDFRGPFRIAVQEGQVVEIISATSQPDMNRTLSNWLQEIQTMCVDRCRVDNDEDPYYDCTIEYDETMGYPTYFVLDLDQFIVDEELYYRITNFSSCEGDFDDVSNSAVCIDYETVKTDYAAAIEKWNLIDDCYDYFIERQGRISDEFRGPFEVQVRDGVPHVMNMPSNSDGAERPNMTFTLLDWMTKIDEHCVAGCEVANNEDAYYYCSLEYHSTWGFPTSIFFDPDENIADEELYYTVSNFTPCESRVVPETDYNETSNCTYQTDDAYEFEAAYAKLETLLTDNLCYDFTYVETGFLYPPPQPVMVRFRDDSIPSQSSDDEFASLLEVMSFYRETCFPCNDTARPFACSITYDDLGLPKALLIDYVEMLADEEMGYTISNVTFVPCSEDPSQQNCDPEWRVAKEKWSSPACYDYSIRRVGEIPVEREGTFVVKVRDDKVINGTALSVNMTVDDLFALVEEKCIAGCPDTEAYQCANTYDAEFGFPTQISIDYDDLMADKDEIYIISDFIAVKCESGHEDDGAVTVCQEWEHLRTELESIEDNWEDPPCYQYTMKRNNESALTVHVRNFTVASPKPQGRDDESWIPVTVDEFLVGIRASCIDGCPSMGVANCSHETSGEDFMGSWVITTKTLTTSFAISDYKVVSCDEKIVTIAEDTPSSAAVAKVSFAIGLVATIVFLFSK